MDVDEFLEQAEAKCMEDWCVFVIVKEEGGNKENAVEETEENPEEVEDEAIPEEIVRDSFFVG